MNEEKQTNRLREKETDLPDGLGCVSSQISVRRQLFKQFLLAQASVLQYPFAAHLGQRESRSTHLIPAGNIINRTSITIIFSTMIVSSSYTIKITNNNHHYLAPNSFHYYYQYIASSPSAQDHYHPRSCYFRRHITTLSIPLQPKPIIMISQELQIN